VDDPALGPAGAVAWIAASLDPDLMVDWLGLEALDPAPTPRRDVSSESVWFECIGEPAG